MKLLRLFGAVIIAGVLTACGSPPRPSFNYFTSTTAEAWVAQKAGTAVPANAVIFHSYEEKWSLRQPDDLLNTTYSCNKSKVLRGDRKLSLREQQGNQVLGMLLYSNECGGSEMNEVAGRFDSQFLYLYYTKSNATSVQRFRIVNGGRLLQRDQNITQLAGADAVYSLPQNGGKDGNKTYSTTSFLSTTDQSTANAGQGNRRAAGQSEPASGALAAKVRELKQLLDEKLITEDEYKTRRDKLISESLAR